jgi:hypothetical protein
MEGVMNAEIAETLARVREEIDHLTRLKQLAEGVRLPRFGGPARHRHRGKRGDARCLQPWGTALMLLQRSTDRGGIGVVSLVLGGTVLVLGALGIGAGLALVFLFLEALL